MKIVVAETNITRKDFVIESIFKRNPKVVGPHRLVMKVGSDNFRSRVVKDLAQFNQQADGIVANRITDDIRDVADRVFSRDLFGKD